MKKLLYIVIVLFFAQNAFAAPSITSVSGSIQHGESITISGSDFGSHADYGGSQDYLPYIFEDAEYDGSYLSVGNWSSTTDHRGQLNSANNRPNSSYNILHRVLQSSETYTNCYGNSTTSQYQYGLKAVPGEYSQVFMSTWIYLEPTFNMDATGGTDQCKILGLGIQENAAGDSYKQHTLIDGDPDNTSEWYIGLSTDSPTETARTDSTTPLVEGQWQRHDFWIDRNNEVSYWIDGELIRNEAYNETEYTNPTLDDISFIQYMKVFDSDKMHMLTDDHYLSFTQARVEIGNASTWAACTHIEVQIPTVWSGTSITVDLNQGSFGSGDTVYLYVVDANGAVNTTGYAITVGSQSRHSTITQGQTTIGQGVVSIK